jgi:hypothetical protein
MAAEIKFAQLIVMISPFVSNGAVSGFAGSNFRISCGIFAGIGCRFIDAAREHKNAGR